MHPQPAPLAIYSPCGVAPGCGFNRPLPTLVQSVLALFVTSIYFGFFALPATNVPCAFNCNRTGVPPGAGVSSGTIVFSGIGEHSSVGVGFGLGVCLPVGVGAGVGVAVGAGPEHIATLTSDNGGKVGVEDVLPPPPPQLMNNAAATKPSIGVNTRNLRHHIIAH